MTAPPRARVAVGAAIIAAAGLGAYLYIASHELGRWLERLLAGKPVDWHPPPKAGAGTGAERGGELAVAIAGPLRLALLALLALGTLVALTRARARQARARSLITLELRLGRDDLAHPFRVQEAFEGIVGALGARWYQRLFCGQDHLALEVHRMPDQSIHFTVACPAGARQAIEGPLEDLYPDVELVAVAGRPQWSHHLMRLKKRRSYLLSIQTLKNYEHAFSEALVALLSSGVGETSVQIVLTPTPGSIHRRARTALKRRERALGRDDRRDPIDPGAQSVVEFKELQGAMETQHRSLLYFDIRIVARHRADAARAAGVFAQLRSENELARRDMRLRRRLYARRVELALPNPIPGWARGILSTSELATIWQLPRARAKHAQVPRSTQRRAAAPPEIDRDPAHQLLEDEHGPVGIAPADRKYGHALLGGQGGGKSSVIVRRVYSEARHGTAAIVLKDPKGPLAELALGLIDAGRTVHYLDLGHPEVGFNPLTLDASPGARASLVLAALKEANPPGAIQAASDSFLRQAIAAVCAAEGARATFWHVYRMLDFQADSAYRQRVVGALEQIAGMDFARSYWRREFPALLGDRGFAAQALNPARNKIERLISTREIDILLRHPTTIDLEQIIANGEVLIVNGAKAAVGEDNTVFVMQLLLQLLHRAVQAQQRRPVEERRRVALFVDEAHNVLTPSVATMLAEGRSAGLEATFAWQYSAQITDEVIRSGVRSLLQSISLFRMREMEDARSLAGLAMEVYSDRISVEQEEQERLRFSADDILRLPVHHAINLWVAGGQPRSGFVAKTLPMEDLHDEQLAAHHRDAQRDRGGRHPDALPPPVEIDVDGEKGSEQPSQPHRRARKPKPSERPDTAPGPPSGAPRQVVALDDLTDLE